MLREAVGFAVGRRCIEGLLGVLLDGPYGEVREELGGDGVD